MLISDESSFEMAEKEREGRKQLACQSPLCERNIWMLVCVKGGEWQIPFGVVSENTKVLLMVVTTSIVRMDSGLELLDFCSRTRTYRMHPTAPTCDP